jgi:quercetin dioxygenase-like cupin family protein
MELPGKHAPSLRVGLFGGVGTVKVWSLLQERAEPFTAVLSCELDPGGHVGRHKQQEFPEIVVGIDGDGEATIGGVRRSLGPGDTVFLPLGEVMELRNLSESAPLRYLIIKARVASAPAEPGR